jgi:hypothetical protein
LIILGIHTPFVYIGGPSSIFGLHLEDQNLLSINYKHHGAPKIWYAVAKKNKEVFINYLRSVTNHLNTFFINHFISLKSNFRDVYKQDFEICSAAYKHKFFFLDPFLVAKIIEENQEKYGIIDGPLFNFVIQQPDEFVITGVEVFHSGYNMGININEAINFGYEDWNNLEKNREPEIDCHLNCEYRSEGSY